jgi:predicted anti-sigma-YlaC factor YlaD
MDCRQFLEEMSNYVDDEVSVGIREAIQEHLAFCHKCEVLYNSTRKTLEIISDWSQETFPLPADASERLYARLRSRLSERK